MKKIIIILVATLTCLGARAQEFNRNEFSVNTGGGASSLQNKPAEGKNLWNWTATAGLGYRFFFNPRWSIGTGANLSIYNGGILLDTYSHTQTTTNLLTGNVFDFSVSSTDYKEMQQAMLLSFPLTLQYQSLSKTAF